MKWLLPLLLASTAALADDYPPGLFEKSPEYSCDMQHQCYHMDPAHPDKVTPPPAPQYPPPGHSPSVAAPSPPTNVPAAPEALAPPMLQELPPPPPSESPNDPQSCFNLRRGLFLTEQAAANARARCH